MKKEDKIAYGIVVFGAGAALLLLKYGTGHRAATDSAAPIVTQEAATTPAPKEAGTNPVKGPSPDPSPPAGKVDVRSVIWRVSETLPNLNVMQGDIKLTDDAKKRGTVFLAVQIELSGALLAEQTGNQWQVEYKLAQFKLQIPDGSTLLAQGFAIGGGSGFIANANCSGVPAASVPDTVKVGAFFTPTKETVEKGGLKFQVKNATPVDLNPGNKSEGNK